MNYKEITSDEYEEYEELMRNKKIFLITLLKIQIN